MEVEMILLSQMVTLFLIMLIGVLCRKKGLLDDHGSRVLSGIVVNVANPALILSSSINPENVIEGRNLLYTVFLAVGIYTFLLVLAKLVPVVLRVAPVERGTYEVMTVFSNIGFMGFPVISAVYGSDALLYASIFLLPYNFLIYTYGIYAMRGERVGEKEAHSGRGGMQWKKIFNIGVVACVLSLIIYLARIPMPGFIEKTIDSLSNLTAPLSMIVIGDSIAKMDIRKLVRDIRLLIFSAVKLLAIPIVGTLIIKLLGVDAVLVGVCMIMLAAPVGSMTAMLAQQYDGDYELASKGVALSTILSVATMPFVFWVLGL